MAQARARFLINPIEPFFIFDTQGEWHATVLNNCIWDARGRYLGFVRGPAYDVYTAYGQWIGRVTPDGRIVRQRVYEQQPLLTIKKLKPRRPRNLPDQAPSPLLNTDLDYRYVDVLDWDPDVFKNRPNPDSDLSYDVS